ncbi:MAG TPA: YCF48-related protein [Bryobacteraceae bacterium]|nr:YCF48-related protein [Bryobacteraceae bacterium]
MRSSIAFFLLCCASLAAAPRMEMQFFHDVNQEEMKFGSIGFCSATRGVAVGVLVKKGSVKPVAMVTSNGGQTWTQMETDEPGYGVFFLDETSGWMLTESGIWFTDECGRSWRRIHKRRGLREIRFVSQSRGWAVGENKTAIETFDGGKTWTKMKAAADLDVNAERTSFGVIAPLNAKDVLIVGRSAPIRFRRFPVWLDPFPQLRRELPAMTVTLETRDGGQTWKSSKASMFGRVSAMATAKSGIGLLLVEFDEFFEYPSELHRLDPQTGKNTVTIRRKDFAITDVAASTSLYAAGFQPPGALFQSPIPGKVRIAHSKDAQTWAEYEVDYRAVATRVTLAESGGRLWAATDTGMILSLVPE